MLANNLGVKLFGKTSYSGTSLLAGYDFGGIHVTAKWDYIIGGSGVVPATATGQNLSLFQIRTVVPLWTPAKPANQVVAKY